MQLLEPSTTHGWIRQEKQDGLLVNEGKGICITCIACIAQRNKFRKAQFDARSLAALDQIMQTETDQRLRRAAHHALKHHDPSYKAAFDAQAKRGLTS